MEVKKHPKANLEKYKGVFLELGLIVTLGLVLLAFEWSSSTSSVGDLGTIEDVEIEEEIVPITRQDQVKPPPPPPAPKVSEVLTIVEDDVEIEEEYEVEDVEADMETEIEIVEVEEEEEEEPIFFIVEEMPEFPGGELALRKFIAQNVKYPAIARENDIQGKVYVRFCVTSKGTVEKVSVARGVDPLLDEEAVRVVKQLPKWKPGRQRGKPVNVWYTVPINFQLQ
jgi:periplasmic protein TonB